MNWAAIGLGAVVVLLMLPPSKKIQKGKVYTATFRPPPSAIMSAATIAAFQGIMPAGSNVVVLSNGDLSVTFTSVTDAELTDVNTPLGVFKVLGVREVS
jgi:hypothetical protein